MPRENKFKPGPVIKTVGHVDTLIKTGNWIYLFNRPKHPSWISGMTLRTINSFIRRGNLKVALENKLYNKKEKHDE